ncbi:hypothetical protein OROGR_022155 [Orobanche gracilis]
MGKHGKKQSSVNHRRGKRASDTVEDYSQQEFNEYSQSSSYAGEAAPSGCDLESQEEDEESQEKDRGFDRIDNGIPSKYSLYQQSVQSMQLKQFSFWIIRKQPLCVNTGVRLRTSDPPLPRFLREPLRHWGNSPKGDISYLQKFFLMYVGGRVPLHLQEDFCGTALLSVEWLHGDARRTALGLDLDVEALNWCLENNINRIGADVSNRLSLLHGNVLQPLESKLVDVNPNEIMQNMTLKDSKDDSIHDVKSLNDIHLPARDIVCAFNYSCCCLHNRKELILYFNHALSALSKKGGIFVMDLYGGTSSEGVLRLQRKFSDFTGLWSLPEIKDCLEEAGFRSVHFWIRSMPDSEQIRCTDGFSAARDVKYEEATSFQQQDSWNAYIVGIA